MLSHLNREKDILSTLKFYRVNLVCHFLTLGDNNVAIYPDLKRENNIT